MNALRKLGTQLGVFVLWLIHFLPMKWGASAMIGRPAAALRCSTPSTLMSSSSCSSVPQTMIESSSALRPSIRKCLRPISKRSASLMCGKQSARLMRVTRPRPKR